MTHATNLTPSELASHVATILTNLCAAIARLLCRKPLLILHTAPLWSYINRTRQRFTRLMTRLSEGTLPTRTQAGEPTSAAPSATQAAEPKPPSHKLPSHKLPSHKFPTGKAWLLKALGWEVVAYMTQLEHLFSRPGAHEILTAAPQAGRLLRPIAHMLGGTLPALITLPRRLRPQPKPGTPKRKRQPRPHTWPMIYPWDPRYKGPKVTF